MRIRRNASRILGSAACVYAQVWPSPAPTSAAVVEAEEEIYCELNCSPWDVMEMEIDPYCYSFGSIFKGEGEGEDEVEKGGGILGNTVKIEEEEPISAITSTAAELTLKEMKDQKVRKKKKQVDKRKKMNNKGKEKLAAEQVMDSNTAAALVVRYCKKSDGKGWHCKRSAQLPHTLCSYHLAQLRSYSSNHHSHNSKAPDASLSAAAGGAVDGSNLYYYYGGFGPWRAKRRGRPCNASKLKEEALKLRDRTEESGGDHDEDSIVAGDDEYDLDCFDDGDDGDDDDNYSMRKDDEETNENKQEVEEKKKKLPKKRGRKPIKARSLKSLL